MKAVVLVFLPEFSGERRLFIKDNKGKECQPNKKSVLEQADAAKEQSLAEDQQRHGNIHGIAHPAIESGNYEVLWGSDGRRRPQPLDREPSKGVKQDGKTGSDHQRSDDAEDENPEQGRSEAPVSHSPWDIDSERSRSYNQKDC